MFSSALGIAGWVIASAGLLAAIVFAIGRKADRTPRCRRCRYPVPAPDNPGTCSECGRNLAARFGVVIGLRRRPVKVLVIAAFLLTLGSAVGGHEWWAASEGEQPAWRLLVDLYLPGQGRTQSSASELAFRFETNTLPAWEREVFLHWTLAALANPMPDRDTDFWRDQSVVTSATVRGLTDHAQQQRLVDSLVESLRDDELRHNAGSASYHLQRLGPIAYNPLLDALESDDRQQRQLAASVLGRIPGAPRTTAMYDVWVEALAEDGRWTLRTGEYNAQSALRHLIGSSNSARPQLRRALQSSDPQQRFLAAYILCVDGHTDLADRLIPMMLPHLRDNNIGGDAVGAAVALYKLGPIVEEPLLVALTNADEQQRQAIELILWDLVEVPITDYDFQQRRLMCSLSPRYRDPLIEMSPEWLRIPRFPVVPTQQEDEAARPIDP